MRSDIDRVLIDRDRIAQRVGELARQITADHSPPAMTGEAEVTIVPVLTGAMIFCCDLIRHMPMYLRIGLMTVSSYPGSATQSQGAKVLDAKLAAVRGRHVLVVDDILDSGNTLKLVVPLVRELGAASVKTCVLLRKDRPAARQTPCDYVGFEIPDEFVVGYGLDYNDFYRNLPDIVTLRAAAIERRA
jgi:hypoxanthine phosphoribosyltransferase